MKQQDSRVELHIDLGKGAEERNMQVFDQLCGEQAALEQAYGSPLEWQALPESRGCRIYGMVEGGWKTPEADWPALQDRLKDAMVQLEYAFRAPVAKLKV